MPYKTEAANAAKEIYGEIVSEERLTKTWAEKATSAAFNELTHGNDDPAIMFGREDFAAGVAFGMSMILTSEELPETLRDERLNAVILGFLSENVKRFPQKFSVGASH